VGLCLARHENSTFDPLGIIMIIKMLRGKVLVRSNDEFIVVIVLNIIESAPKSDNTTLEIVCIYHSDSMNIDSKFDGRGRRCNPTILEDRVSILTPQLSHDTV
jgi:hypothetical protein